MFIAFVWVPVPRPRVYLVSEMLDRLLQGQDLVEERALEYRLEQAELLLSGHLPSLLQFGLETLHRLQGTLCICKPSKYFSDSGGRSEGVDAGRRRHGRDRGGVRE